MLPSPFHDYLKHPPTKDSTDLGIGFSRASENLRLGDMGCGVWGSTVPGPDKSLQGVGFRASGVGQMSGKVKAYLRSTWGVCQKYRTLASSHSKTTL